MDTIQERHFITYAGNENTFHKINEIAGKKEIEEKEKEVACADETHIEEKEKEVACSDKTQIEKKDEDVYSENVWWFGV